jgi:hypothetical protein
LPEQKANARIDILLERLPQKEFIIPAGYFGWPGNWFLFPQKMELFHLRRNI